MVKAASFPIQQPQKARTKCIGINALLFGEVMLVACLQVMILSIYTINDKMINTQTPSFNAGPQSHRDAGVKKDESNALSSNITLVGISFSDDTISDAAVKYLLEAACEYQIQSYILLSKRIHKNLLEKKIYMLSQHLYMPLAKGGTVRQPACGQRIHVSEAPSETDLILATKERMEKTGENLNLVEGAPNNPLNKDRIATIKRIREHQREMLRDKVGLNVKDLKRNVIALFDLDMFDYPPILKVIDVSGKYMFSSLNENMVKEDNIDAICSNGIQRSRWWDQFPRKVYYDVFATILLPNTWPVLESKRTVPRGLLEGENITMSKISQPGLLDHFLTEGFQKSKDSYKPVPVRSCFGGLTLYRADLWLHPTCRYDLYNKSLDVYRGKEEQQTCEHVVFHECLRQQREDFSIAVQPDMMTLWHLM